MAAPSSTPLTQTGPEEWRPFVGFEGTHEVSNYGRVRRTVWHTRWRADAASRANTVLKHHIGNHGYPYVHLTDGKGKKRKVDVHSAVLRAFVGPRPRLMQAAHLDGDKTNPCLANLAYVTALENNLHKQAHGTAGSAARGTRSGNAKLTNDEVVGIRALRARHGAALPYRVIGGLFGISHETARTICERKAWAHVPSLNKLAPPLRLSSVEP